MRALDRQRNDLNQKDVPCSADTLSAAVLAACLAGGALATPLAFNLPAQPLAESIKQVARAAGISIAVDNALVAGRSAPALRATEEPAQALRRPSRQDPDRRAAETLYGLHTGQYESATIKWAYFFLGFSGAWLFYSGNLLWIESRRKTVRKGGEVEQSRSTRLLGAATVGVCLGCVAGLSLTIVAAKWLHGHVADLNHWHEYIYYAVFLGSVAWAFACGAARSVVHLLWLCAAATMAVPTTTVLALLFPALGLWAHGSAATIGVDVTAFIGALCLAWMALATKRRIRNGPSDSIWSIRKDSQLPSSETHAILAK